MSLGHVPAGPAVIAPAVIAIDGPAASGKGTLARAIARRFGLRHLDTGALYRAVGRDVLHEGADPSDAAAATYWAARLDPGTLDDPRLRDEDVADAASRVAVHEGVRTALLDLQRAFVLVLPGAVLDGRDVGTAVLPDAGLKLYVVADAEARADRRYREQLARGVAADRAVILAEIRQRDARDAGRELAPMKPAADALVIDTSALDADQVFALAERIVLDRLPSLR